MGITFICNIRFCVGIKCIETNIDLSIMCVLSLRKIDTIYVDALME